MSYQSLFPVPSPLVLTSCFCFFPAERRAQLARSRSRSNVLQGQSPISSPDVVREISFNDSLEASFTAAARSQNPKSRQRRDRDAAHGNWQEGNRERGGGGNNNNNSKLPNGDSGLTEAEELLNRLKALWLGMELWALLLVRRLQKHSYHQLYTLHYVIPPQRLSPLAVVEVTMATGKRLPESCLPIGCDITALGG